MGTRFRRTLSLSFVLALVACGDGEYFLPPEGPPLTTANLECAAPGSCTDRAYSTQTAEFTTFESILDSEWVEGDVFAGIGTGRYDVFTGNGAFKETLDQMIGSGETTGCAFDPPIEKLYTTNFQGTKVVVFEREQPHSLVQVVDPLVADASASHSESVVFDSDGNFFVGHADGNGDVHKYDAAGNFITSYDVEVESRGSDWVELAADQKTIFYTSEGRRIMRYDTETRTQLEDFAVLEGVSNNFALRLLPPGDGSGGLLVADFFDIKRLDAGGNTVATYDAPSEDSFFALNLDPDGSSFWSAGIFTGLLYQFDIASGEILNTVDTEDPSVAGLCVQGELTVAVPERADLSIVKTASPDPVDVGGALTYTLDVSNAGPNGAMGVMVTDDLPSSVSFTSAESSQGSCSESGGTVTCDLGDLAAAGTATVSITVQANTAGDVSNTGSVSASGPEDPDSGNNSSTVASTITGAPAQGADVSINKSGPASVSLGESFAYTLTVSNAGPDAAPSVAVSDNLPDGVSFQSLTTSQGSCDQAGGTVTCQLGELASGATATITINVTADAAGEVVNTASVESAGDPNSGNNQDEASTNIVDDTTQPLTCTTVGFDDLGSHGDLVTSFMLGESSIAVSASGSGASSSDDARLYDSDLADGVDPDLKWEGGACPDCQGQGKLLVVSDNDFATEGDSKTGGTITFTGFQSGAWVLRSVKLFDNDRGAPFMVMVDNGTVGQTTVGADGNVQTVQTGDAGIAEMVSVKISESGALDDLEFCTAN